MKTLEDFLATLAPSERVFLDHMEQNVKRMPEAYILLDGQPVKTHMIVAVLWQIRHPEAIRVDRTQVGDTSVSTVFITFPLPNEKHFETMCFGPKRDYVAKRYKTLEAAREGHASVVKGLAT